MKAALVESVGKVAITTVPDPAPGPRDVVVEVAACGLCGTDLHILQGEFAPVAAAGARPRVRRRGGRRSAARSPN